MFGRKPADGVGGGSSANAQSTPPAKKGFAAGLFGTSATPRSAPGASKPAPRTPQADLRDDDLPGMFTRATTLLENVQRRVSASSGAQGAKGTADDADNARQFMRVNEVKRLTTRIRVGLMTLADAGEKGAWEAQLAFLESETATAVEAVLRVASPAPAETRPSERRNETTTGEAKTLNMFAGLNVSPAPPTTTTQSRMRSASPSPVSPSPKSAVTGVPSTSAATPAPAPTASLALGGGDGRAIQRIGRFAGAATGVPGDAYVHGDTYVLGDAASAASAARVPRDLHRASAAAAGRVGVLDAGDERSVVADDRNRAARRADGLGRGARRNWFRRAFPGAEAAAARARRIRQGRGCGAGTRRRAANDPGRGE